MPATPASPLCRLADNLCGGCLADRLLEWRAEGQSWDSIARLIFVETNEQVGVNGATVIRWARQLGIQDVAPTEAVS